MIYIYSGNDIKNKNLEIKKISKNKEIFFVTEKEKIFEYLDAQNLFGEYPCVILDGFFDNKISFLKKEILELKESKTVFIFKEDSFNSLNLKKYKDFILFNSFEKKEIKENKMNISFEVANAFGVKDKIKTWILFNQAIEKGVEPEQITGILFWKIKSLSSFNQNYFSEKEVKRCSKLLISLYHEAHLGKRDFTIGLEQFLLSVLSK